MADGLWLDYDGPCDHDMVKDKQTYVNNPRCKRHQRYGCTVALPEHLVRIEFVTGDHCGCMYVYSRELAEKLVKTRRAVISEIKMESEPLRIAEVMAAINAARKRDGVPLLRRFEDISEREPGQEG